MATSVGEAFIRIHGDTTGVDDDVAAAIRRIETRFGRSRLTERLFPERDRNRIVRSFDRMGGRIMRSFRRIPLLGPVLASPFLIGARAAQGMVTVLEGLGGWLSTIATRSGGLGGRLAELGAAIATGLAAEGPIVAIAALSAAVIAFAASLALLAAGLSLAVGALTALAAPLAFAIGGGLLLLGPLLLGAAAAAGVLVAAFTGLTDAQKKAFAPLVKQFTATRDRIREIIGSHFEGWAKGLQAPAAAVGKIMEGVARAVGLVGDSFVAVANSPDVKAFLDALAKALPVIVGRLGAAAAELTRGLAGVFRAILPFALRFAGVLKELAIRFANWANSAKGQNQIKDFMDKAWQAGRTLFSILGNLVKIVGTLFSAGQPTGQGFLEGINSALERFNTWLNSDEGRESLKQWFKDAKEFIGAVARVLGEVIAFFDKLDTPRSRQWVIDLISVIGTLLGLANSIVITLAGWIRSVQGWIASVRGLGTTVSEAFSGATLAVSNFVSGVVSFFTGLPTRIALAVSSLVISVVNGFAGLAGKVITAAGDLTVAFATWGAGVLGAVTGLAGRIVGAFTGLASRMITAAGSLLTAFALWLANLPGQAARTAQNVVNTFLNLAGRMITAAGSILAQFVRWIGGLPGEAEEIARRVVNAFRGLAGRIVAAAGSLVSAIGSWFSGAAAAAGRVADNIVGAFRGLGGRIVAAIGSIRLPRPSFPDIPGLPFPFAAGGIVTRPTLAMIGEAGPEAVVPLSSATLAAPVLSMLSGRSGFPASQADVRIMRDYFAAMRVQATRPNVAMTVVSPAADPRIVAAAVVDRLVAGAR